MTHKTEKFCERQLILRAVLITNPRSGTHWFKSLLAACLGKAPVEQEFRDEAALSAAIECMSSDQFIYGHFSYSRFAQILDPGKRPGLRLIVLTRHPLDRLISQLAWERALEGNLPDSARSPQRLARELMMGEWDGKAWENGSVVPDFAAMHEFYLSDLVTNWLKFRRSHLVRFEDLISDPANKLTACLHFLEHHVSRERIECAIESNSFINLSNGRTYGQIDPHSHYRRGEPGEWREVFDAIDIELLRLKYAVSFREAGGYEL